jgi:hypothetical protein
MLCQADYTGYFGDIRLERRGRRLLERLFHNGTKSLQALPLSRAEQKGYYHLLRSEKVSEEKLIEELAARSVPKRQRTKWYWLSRTARK